MNIKEFFASDSQQKPSHNQERSRSSTTKDRHEDNTEVDDTTQPTKTTSDPSEAPAVSFNHSSSTAGLHQSTAVWESRETYGPPGFRGLSASPFVATCAAFSALGGLLFGYDQGVVSVILVMPQFLDVFPRISDDVPNGGFWKGVMTSMIQLGAFVGALNQSWLADRYSRKWSIVVAVIIFTVGSALQTAAVDFAMLCVARMLGGVGIGMLSMVAPLYISEISPPEIRGALLVLEEFSIVLGICIAYWITYGTQYMSGEWSWRLPFLLQMLPGFVLGGGIAFFPFSPRWLVSAGRETEALDSLCRLRRVKRDDPRVVLEWWDIKKEVALQRDVLKEKHPRLAESVERKGGTFAGKVGLELAAWGDLFRKSCWRRTVAGAGVMFFQQFVGINALIYYSPTLFGTMGLDHSMQLILSGILNVTQLIGVSSSLWTMDALGRRPLLMLGSAAMFVSHFIIAVLVGLYSDDWAGHTTQGWVSAAFLFLYMLSFGASWGPVPWAYPSEIFPSTLRGKGVSLTTSVNWLTNWIIGLITPPLIQNTGFGAYVFFAVFCALSAVFTWFFVKETRGRRLEQMDGVFGDGEGVRREGGVDGRGDRDG